jgi:REP element-mobilizing transposase RayT
MNESEYIHKSHNVSVLLYYFVCSAKYRRVVFNIAVNQTLKESYLEIGKRYGVHFLVIGTDKDHVRKFQSKIEAEIQKLREENQNTQIDISDL